MNRERWSDIARDAAIGLGLAVLIVLIVIFSSAVQPSFIYQAF